MKSRQIPDWKAGIEGFLESWPWPGESGHDLELSRFTASGLRVRGGGAINAAQSEGKATLPS